MSGRCEDCGNTFCVCEDLLSERPDANYDKKEFNSWFRKLCHADYPCFFRDILRAQEKNLWEQFKITADEYHGKDPAPVPEVRLKKIMDRFCIDCGGIELINGAVEHHEDCPQVPASF